MSDFDYINRTYGLSLKRGSRIEYTGNPRSPAKLGSVTSADGHYINIRFDGEPKATGPFHPTWELRQIQEQTP
jgi:hypothetical protein